MRTRFGTLDSLTTSVVALAETKILGRFEFTSPILRIKAKPDHAPGRSMLTMGFAPLNPSCTFIGSRVGAIFGVVEPLDGYKPVAARDFWRL